MNINLEADKTKCKPLILYGDSHLKIVLELFREF